METYRCVYLDKIGIKFIEYIHCKDIESAFDYLKTEGYFFIKEISSLLDYGELVGKNIKVLNK